ncbi:MAG TPA: response regulator [Bacteroidales bacterium]|nr:response regulator [Bacteroidales bacterium]HPS62930.1 response regulator [Bacteroidales bacterium]
MTPTKIIIFEDEFLLATDLKQQIQKHGYEVIALFRKAEEGIHFIRSIREPEELPEIILMDISLAGSMNGIEAARILQKEFNFTLVFLTGMSQMNIFEEAFETRPHEFLIKPFDIQQALVSIRLAVNRKQIEDELNRCLVELKKKETDSLPA